MINDNQQAAKCRQISGEASPESDELHLRWSFEMHSLPNLTAADEPVYPSERDNR